MKETKTDKKEKARLTKGKILESASRFFYQYGYDNTNFEQIAEDCGITKPLITYHFGKKSTLAGEVYQLALARFNSAFVEKVLKVMPEANALATAMACAASFVEYFHHDENACRFYLELMQFVSIEELGDLEHLYQAANTMLDKNISKERVHMIYVASKYALHGLIKHYLLNDIGCSEEEFMRFFSFAWLSLFEISMEMSEEYASLAEEILDCVTIRHEEYFRIKVIAKKH